MINILCKTQSFPLQLFSNTLKYTLKKSAKKKKKGGGGGARRTSTAIVFDLFFFPFSIKRFYLDLSENELKEGN